MGIHATEDLTALIAQGIEPYRSGHYDFDDYQLVTLAWTDGRPGELSTLHVVARRDFHMDEWNAARKAALEEMQAGRMVKLLGRVFN